MKKADVRNIMKTRRNELTKGECDSLSKTICNRFIESDFYEKSSCIYIYVDAKNEVKTKELIEYCINNGKYVAVPKVNGEVMEFYQITSMNQLKPGCFGILEPIDKVVPAAPDIIIVPGVAFSVEMDRVGYGKGYYDKYLSDDVIKVAFAYEFQVVEHIDAQAHDKKMDYIITENKIYK